MPEPRPPQPGDGQSARRIAFTGFGVLLITLGAVVANGWPFMIGGFLLLIASSQAV